MFGHTPLQTPTSELDRDLQELKALLKEKHLNVKVVKVCTSSDDEIKVTLLNGRHGVNEGIDAENARPIEYLQSFGANVSQEKAEHAYWSHSVITFHQSKLKEIIDGLKLIPMPKLENNHGKVMAKC
jgi:hypothetical protein